MVWIAWKIFTDKWLARAERGEQYIDDGDRFVSLWIAFNGWMKGKFGEDTAERSQIESVKTILDFQDVFNNLKLKNNEFRMHLDEFERIPVVDMRFKKGLETIFRYDGTFESLIEVIYQVRCNLFHGRKNINEDTKDFNLVSLSYKILLPLFKAYLSKTDKNEME